MPICAEGWIPCCVRPKRGKSLEQLSAFAGRPDGGAGRAVGSRQSKLPPPWQWEELAVPLQVGQLSAVIERGRRRPPGLFALLAAQGLPIRLGFSVVELDMDSRELHRMYPEFLRHAAGCKFSSCLHIHEPDCAVKEYVRLGK